MYNINAKSLLARLLAEENINVEFTGTNTASFNVKTRVLTIPILKDDLSNDVITLFIGHEVGHALFTPTDFSDCDIPKCILNILEDIRIEKKIQVRYPGIKREFVSGYAELYNNNFFGTMEFDTHTANFLDKLNLYAKLGLHVQIQFSEEEQYYVDKAMVTETYDDVIEVAKEIYNYLTDISDDSLESADYDFDTEYGEASEFDDTVPNIIESKTHDAYEENYINILSDDVKDVIYLSLDIKDSSSYILSYRDIYNDICKYTASRNRPMSLDYTAFAKFNAQNMSIIQYMINEFNIQRNAKDFRKVNPSKIGDIDPSKLFSYRVSDTIFKNITVTADNKSHGLVLFLDWSGSMAISIHATIVQLLNVVTFCRKLSIPYDVYAFSSNSHIPKNNRHSSIPLPNSINVENVTLFNFLSSSMTDSEFKDMATILLTFDNNSNYYPYDKHTGYCLPDLFTLSRTPLDDTIILSMDIIPKFKKKHRLDKVHTIFLTDGESYPTVSANIKHPKFSTYNGQYEGRKFKSAMVYIRESATKITKRIKDAYTSDKIKSDAKGGIVCKKHTGSSIFVGSTIALFSILKEYIDDNVVVFRIVSAKKHILDYYFTYSSNNVKPTDINKNSYVGINSDFVDKIFLIRGGALGLSDDADYAVDSNYSVKKIATKFSKSMSSKVKNRVFLKEFISMIS